MATLTIDRASRRTLTVQEWMSKKTFSTFSCKIRKNSVSLSRQKFTCGTDAAESSRQFLYPNILENNTTAPCRVCGNAPGSYASNTLTTRSAVSLCQKLLVMTTVTISRATRRTLTVQEWMSKKNEWFSVLCGEEFTNKHVVLAHLYCVALIAACIVAGWLEGGAL